jgi:hypothetical protein
MLEGLPSTGKTYNARFINIQLERNNINAEWIHEIAIPNPVIFFDEAGMTYDEYDRFIKAYPEAASILNSIAVFKKSTVGIHLPELEWNYMDKIGENVYQELLEYDVWKFPHNKYKDFALEKWAYFTEKALKNHGKVYVIDSAIFQFQIFTFLFENKTYEELQRFIDQITEIILPLNPCLIFLHRENTEATIDYLERDRGTSYLEYLWQRDKNQPYYAGKPPGAESFKQFLRDYAGMANQLYDRFPLSKLSLEISDGNWAYLEDEMLSFLGIKRVTSPDFLPRNGIYKNDGLGYEIKVDGLSIIDPAGKARKLFPKSQNEFYIDWLPTVLRFEDGRLIISGSQICDQWTATGMAYNKIDQDLQYSSEDI